MLILLIGYHKNFGNTIMHKAYWNYNKQTESKRRFRKTVIYNRRYNIMASCVTLFRKQNIINGITMFMVKKEKLLKKFHIWRLKKIIYLCNMCCDDTAASNNYKLEYGFDCYWCGQEGFSYRVVGSVSRYTKTLPIDE